MNIHCELALHALTAAHLFILLAQSNLLMQPAPPLPSLCARASSYACKTKFSMKEVADTDGQIEVKKVDLKS